MRKDVVLMKLLLDQAIFSSVIYIRGYNLDPMEWL